MEHKNTSYDKKCNFTNQTSNNEKIDDFIQEMQLKFDFIFSFSLFQWIPYDDFCNIKEIRKSDFDTIYLAIWGKGLSKYNYKNNSLNITYVTLKHIHNSQNMIDEFLNKVQYI